MFNSVKTKKANSCSKVRKVKTLRSHTTLCIQQMILLVISTDPPSRGKRYCIEFWSDICAWVRWFCWRMFPLISGHDWNPWVAYVPAKDNAGVLRDLGF
jgi:hypothetical protein